jgi:hypothetical protein
MPTGFSLGVAMTLLAPFQSTTETPPQLVMEHLNLEVTIDYDAQALNGHASLTIANVGSDPVTVVPVQLGRLMRVTDVVVGGRRASFTQDIITYEDWGSYQFNQVYVEIEPSIAPGTSAELAVAYEGYLVPYTETGMLYVRDHVSPEFTMLRQEAFAWPSLGVPSRRITRSMPSGDFTFRLGISVPSDQVVATAVPALVEPRADGYTTWKFESVAPVPFLNLPIAPYTLLQRGDVRIFHFPRDSGGAAVVLNAIEQTLRRYTEWFGPIEQAAAITIMEIPEGWGSQANLAAGVILTADAFHNPRSLPALYHELAHFWHPTDTGDPPVRWNEGLATLLQHRVAAVQDNGPALPSAMEERAARIVALGNETPRASVALIDYGRHDLTDLSYSTGALMLYALYTNLGEDRFDGLLAGYFDAFRSTGSDTDQFVEYVSAQSGEDLTKFFHDWVYTTVWYTRLASGETLHEVIGSYRE